MLLYLCTHPITCLCLEQRGCLCLGALHHPVNRFCLEALGGLSDRHLPTGILLQALRTTIERAMPVLLSFQGIGLPTLAHCTAGAAVRGCEVQADVSFID